MLNPCINLVGCLSLISPISARHNMQTWLLCLDPHEGLSKIVIELTSIPVVRVVWIFILLTFVCILPDCWMVVLFKTSHDC